jgi:hypothetical protein
MGLVYPLILSRGVSIGQPTFLAFPHHGLVG